MPRGGQYRVFKVSDSDDPYLTTLFYTNKDQWYALTITQGPEWRSYEECAKQLKIPINTFKTRLHRAKQKIVQWRTEAEQKPRFNLEAQIQALGADSLLPPAKVKSR